MGPPLRFRAPSRGVRFALMPGSLRFRLPAVFLLGIVLTRDQLLERVWGYTFAGDTRTVDVHVRQIRRKLGDASPIVTVWGVGYKVAPAKDAAA